MKNTITDNSDYKPSTLNEQRFSQLSDVEKEYFTILKNGILEIFPTNDKNQHEEMMINYGENFAFIASKAFNKIIETYDAKIKELESKIQSSKTAI